MEGNIDPKEKIIIFVISAFAGYVSGWAIFQAILKLNGN